MAATRTGASADIAALYRAHLFSEQFAAERIAGHFQSGAGGKLLAFLAASDLEAGRGVPYFVTQKVQLRQLVFGSDRGRPATKLLTSGRDAPPGFEIVDRTPRPARD